MAVPLYEPSPRSSPSFSSVDGQIYMWGGRTEDFSTSGGEKIVSIESFDSYLETWTRKPTKGDPPPWFYRGACASSGHIIYMYGGTRGLLGLSSLYEFNTRTSSWRELAPHSADSPMEKLGHGMVVWGEKCVLFGGYGTPSGPTQSGADFVTDNSYTDGRGWTNEMHTFDLKKGTWSSPTVSGTRPPPCSGFSFTMIDGHRAVLFGGNQPCIGKSNDAFIIDLTTMHWSKLDHQEGIPCPVERNYHVAVCLGYCGDDPKLLVTGGLGANNVPLSDVWILDLDSGKWKEVQDPSLQSRFGHCAAAITISPGVTEVVMFGGSPEWPKNKTDNDLKKLSMTTVLRFELQSFTGEWVLTDVTDNSQRGTSERIREKMMRMMSQVMRDQEERVREAERRMSAESNQRAREAERRQAAEQEAREAERRVLAAEQQTREAEGRCIEAERRAREAEERLHTSEEQAVEADRRAQQAEQHSREAERKGDERHWVVQRREIDITEESLGGGGWGEVKVARFRGVKVAAKMLYKSIRTGYYQSLFMREMNMASRIRHPNLVLFIGACMDEGMVILMELMPTSLRREMEKEDFHMSAHQLTSISLDVARALNYLHLIQPDPIVHRDISSANVLLEPLPSDCWRAKVTDYGSVNFQQQLQTVGPGSPAYAAPEAHNPSFQSPKMDIFSFGVLLVEMCTYQFPEVSARERLIASIQDQHWVDLIRRCIQQDKDNRSSAAELLDNIQTFE